MNESSVDVEEVFVVVEGSSSDDDDSLLLFLVIAAVEDSSKFFKRVVFLVGRGVMKVVVDDTDFLFPFAYKI